MPGLGGAIANALARGVADYGLADEQQKSENERKLLAANALARQRARQDREDQLKLLELQGKYGYTPGGDPTDVPTPGTSTALDAMPTAKQPTAPLTPQTETPDASSFSGDPRQRIVQALKSVSPTVVSTPNVQDAPRNVLQQPGLPRRGVTKPSFDPTKSEAGVLADLRGRQAMERARMLEEGRNQRFADGLLTKQDIADMVAEGKQAQVDAYMQAHREGDATKKEIAGMPTRSKAVTSGGDTPQSTASQRDYRNTVTQEVRAENEVKDINTGRARDLKAAPTKADSTRIIQGTQAKLNDAEARKARLQQRADSILNVIPQQRAAGTVVTAPGAPAAAPAPQPVATHPIPTSAVFPNAGQPKAAGNQQADADYAAAAKKYKAALDMGIDPVAAQKAYDATVALLAKKHGQLP